MITYLELLQLVKDGKPPKYIKVLGEPFVWNETVYEDRYGNMLSDFTSAWDEIFLVNDKCVEVIEESFDMAIKALENSRWIPCSERLPNKGQYVLVSTDENRVITATFQGDYWESTFDLDWEEVLAWMPLPMPYYPMGENYGFPSKEEADLWMNGKPVGKEEI